MLFPFSQGTSIKSWGKYPSCIFQHKPEDSGYLSTDSNESKQKLPDISAAGSETDESLGDGHSESGGESIETHSVFFGTYRTLSCMAGSLDSGVDSDLKHIETVSVIEDCSESTDSETKSYATVVPLGT